MPRPHAGPRTDIGGVGAAPRRANGAEREFDGASPAVAILLPSSRSTSAVAYGGASEHRRLRSSGFKVIGLTEGPVVE